MRIRWSLLVLWLLPVLLSACRGGMIFGTKSPHEAYADKLRRAELDNSTMGAQWLAAAGKSLDTPLGVALPYKETGFFPPDNPLAFGYSFKAIRGQKIEIAVQPRSINGAEIFAELWQHGTDGGHKLLEFADSSGSLTFEADEDLQLILRLQTELLAAVSYTLDITAGPSLAFPVQSGDNADIGSIWGDPRDAGARRHEGIDIFGKRGTPVLAAADGRIMSVREGGLGGKQVWMKPAGKNISFYYAHLDSQLVTTGQRVQAGDTIGLMGNTGNARTTAPHLHFGIYAIGGAIDPLPYVKIQNDKAGAVAGDEELLGKPVRTSSAKPLYVSTASKESSMQLSRGTYITITAATGNFYKVMLPDGSDGFVPVNSVSVLSRTLQTISNSGRTEVLSIPVANSAVVGNIDASKLLVKAYYNNYAYIETDSLRGWIISR